MYINVHFNILKQINCALVGLIKDWITPHVLHFNGTNYLLSHFTIHHVEIYFKLNSCVLPFLSYLSFILF